VPPRIVVASPADCDGSTSSERIPRRNIRPGQAAAPPSSAASAVGGMGYHELILRASQLIWMVWVGLQPALSSVAYVSARFRRRCGRRTESAAAATDAGGAPALVRPGEDCRRLKQCLMTPGTHVIFQC
jgi:hypothetical protein